MWQGAAQPGGEEFVAAHHGRAAGARAGCRVVVGDHLGAVGDAPAAGGQVVGEQGLLGGEEQQRVEAAGVEVGGAAGDGGAGEEAEDLGAGQVGGGAERGVGEHLVERIRFLFGADERAGGEQAEPGVGVEEAGGLGEGAGRPPGVVVAERHVGGAQGADAVCAGEGAAVERQCQYADLGEVAGEHGAGAVGGGVVGHDDLRPLGQGEQVPEGGGEAGGAVAGGDDDAYG